MFGAPLNFEQAPHSRSQGPQTEGFTVASEATRKRKAAEAFANLTTPTMSGGLYGQTDEPLPGLIWFRYDQGYFEDKPLWFQNMKPTATGSTQGWTDLNQVGPGDTTPATLPIGKTDSFSMLIKGYFVPKTTGVHQIILGSMDSSYLWWGAPAATLTQDKTLGTASISLPGKKKIGQKWWQIQHVQMTAGTAYPLSIMYGLDIGVWHLFFAFVAPGQSQFTQDLTGYIYGRVATGTTIAASVEIVDSN